MQIVITVDVTAQNAPLLAQLLTGATSGGTIDAAVMPALASAAPVPKPELPTTPKAPKPEPKPEDATTPTTPTDLATAIRAKCLALKKAGKNDVAHSAIESVGYESLSKVPPEKYPELWEVLKDAG